ncbi:MAG: sigma-54 dependent transcriptional regulator [Candidatus Marinimicrobia bacterium]|nr:sigma-54 dependent transcriptional regulator [Candidatus Neomarinimicrobiota bacterium]MCF7850747.1 sigma-54 dependent transcriptional regulator [Candidatus Neomarinimicrobiota bacterium]MCF7905249.1 sigma-54 dependent transcriptional regulator [Candidatus Neomarinimicrobiota bacterium]
MRRILVVDDEKSQRESLAGFLKKIGYEVMTADSAQTALAFMYSNPVDIVLSDYKMPYMSGEDLLREVKARHPETVLILITAFGTVENAVNSMKAGAWDFLTKPVDLEQLESILKAIDQHLQGRHHTDESHAGQDELDLDEFIANDQKMLDLLKQAKRVATSKATVLITGETGVGKEVMADFIHKHSDRSEMNMVAVNCSALPSQLIESELFGHEKGSFTGATAARIGRFEEADKGTLFLDEIGDLPIDMQTKLLRFLQSGEFQRIGENVVKTSDVRIIAATNVDLTHAVEIGEFREDLFYRLNVINLHLPPLRERPTDIETLMHHFLKKYTLRENRNDLSVSNAAIKKLIQYHFPGNVRELGNIVERAVLLCTGNEITPDDLSTRDAKMTIGTTGKLKDSVKDLEATLILETLESSKGNQSECARQLGVSERVLRYKLQKYQLK